MSRKEREREGGKREREDWRAKEDYEKSTSVYREKLGKFIESVKSEVFVANSWEIGSGPIDDSLHPLYPYAARTAPVYRVSYSRVSVCAPRGVPSTFLLFLLTSPRPSRFVLARRATRCFVTPNFRLYPDAAFPEYILSLDAVKKGSWYTGGISVKSTWILVKEI